MWRLPESARRQAARVAAVGCALAIAGCAHAPKRPEGAEYRAALARLPEVNQAPRALEGKPLVVQFFATWCFPCLAAFPALGQLARKDAPRGLRVVAVGMDLEGETVLAPFVAHYQPEFPVLAADPDLREGKTPFGRLTALPVTVALDAEGNPVAGFAGVADLEQLEKLADTVRSP